MRIIIAWGKEEELLNQIIPRWAWTSNHSYRKKRMTWIISKLKRLKS